MVGKSDKKTTIHSAAKDESSYMGVDYGNQRVGIALGRSGYVSPIRTIASQDTRTVLNELNEFIIQNKVAKIVMGLPLSPDGKDTKKSMEVRKFGKIVKIFTKKPLVYQEENFSTLEAETELIQNNVKKKTRRIKDHYAAALILKRYFDIHGIK